MQTLLNTLYLTLPGYLHLENATLRFEVEHETKLRVPLHHLGSVVCFGDVLVSPAVMSQLAEEGKSLIFLDRNGRFRARMEGPISGNVLLRMAQYERSKDADFALRVAKACIAGKLRNSRFVLQRAARDAQKEDDALALRQTVSALASALRNLESAPDMDTVRGYEGEAAREYFAVFPHLIRPDQREAFTPHGRTRRPPQDRMNALLSFLYSLLMNDCRSALETVGLDVQMGFLHSVRPGRAALALDLMEEFRSLWADRLALTLINRLQLKASDFDLRPGGSVQMKDAARKDLVIAYQERKAELTSHPMLEEKMAFGLVPQLQARLLARVIRGEAEDYLPYLER